MGSANMNLVGKSGKKYACSMTWSDSSSTGLGCHAKIIYSLSVTCGGASWAVGDDIRSNKDNWKVIYESLSKNMGSYAHVVISDNFATCGPRDFHRKRLEASGYGDDNVYTSTIYKTSEIMDIINALAESQGDSMTLTPTSGNASHPSAEMYSACITGVWIRKSTSVVVIGRTMREFWDRAKAAIGATERPRVDPASISRDPEKLAREIEEVKKKVSNIWGE